MIVNFSNGSSDMTPKAWENREKMDVVKKRERQLAEREMFANCMSDKDLESRICKESLS